MTWCKNRLTAIGAKTGLQSFLKSRWETALGVKHCELLENSPGRFSCQFETENPPLESLKRLSRRWPRMILLLDYEVEKTRIRGLAKVQAGRIACCQFDC